MKRKITAFLCIMLCAIVWCFTQCRFNFNRDVEITLEGDLSDPSGNRIILMFPELDSMWKPTYQYAVVIPPDTTLNMYYRLIGLLNKNESFTTDNTFIICREEDKESMEDVAPGYFVFGSDFVADKPHCEVSCFYKATKEGKKYLLKKTEDAL